VYPGAIRLYKGTLGDFFQFLLAADDDSYYVVIVQYHWATSPARRIDDINSMPSGRRSGARLRSNAGGEEGYPGRRRAKTANPSPMRAKLTTPPGAPLGGGVTAHRAAVRLSCGRYGYGGRGGRDTGGAILRGGHVASKCPCKDQRRIADWYLSIPSRSTLPSSPRTVYRRFQTACLIAGAMGCSRQESVNLWRLHAGNPARAGSRGHFYDIGYTATGCYCMKSAEKRCEELHSSFGRAA
jgi:hypothetical protein